MPTFVDAYISSLGYLRPNVLFEERRARERSERARMSAEGEKEKSPTTRFLALAVNKSPAVYILSPDGL